MQEVLEKNFMTEDNPEKKKSGFLTKAFTYAVKFATIGIASAVAWQLFLDPLFFQPIHDLTNLTAQAWVAFIQDKFAWIPNLTGMTGDGGLLHTSFAQALLKPYYALTSVASPEMVNSVGPLSATSLLQP